MAEMAVPKDDVDLMIEADNEHLQALPEYVQVQNSTTYQDYDFKGIVFKMACSACPKFFIGQTSGSFNDILGRYGWTIKNKKANYHFTSGTCSPDDVYYVILAYENDTDKRIQLKRNLEIEYDAKHYGFNMYIPKKRDVEEERLAYRNWRTHKTNRFSTSKLPHI